MKKDQEVFKLVFFYTDDCEKCEQIFFMVNEIAEEYSGKALIVARINMNKNEIPEMVGFKFPMLAVLRKFDDSQSATYNENWDMDEIVQWVQDHV